MITVSEIGPFTDALRALGIPVLTVQMSDGAVTIKYDPSATVPQRATGDALIATFDPAAARVLADRAIIIGKLGNGGIDGKLARAVLMVLLDEMNLHALKMNAILDAVDGATTLANLKSAVASIADYPARTKANLITGITNKINAGDVDT